MNASSKCHHPEFHFVIKVANIEDDTIKFADITGLCVTCGKPVVFRIRMPMGMSWDFPTLSPDAMELRLPIIVEGDEVDETKSRPSFTINISEPPIVADDEGSGP